LPDEDKPVSHNGKRRIYRILAHLAWCDGEVHAHERALLDSYRDLHEIRPDEAASLEEEGKRGGELGVSKRPSERTMLIDAMVDMAMADGVLVAAEQERLVKFGKTLGLTQQEIAKRVVERVGLRGKKLSPTDRP
jgi:uncharacterized tellurite resistance protein B-like protein